MSASTETRADRTAHAGANALVLAVILYITAAAASLISQAVTAAPPVAAITILLIAATLAAATGVLAIWASIIIGAIQARGRRA